MKILKGHPHRINDVAFSHDGRLLVSCGNDATVRLWDTATGEGSVLVQGKETAIDLVAFTADSKHVLVRPRWSGLQVWSVTGRCCDELIHPPNAASVLGLAVAPRGTLLVANEWIRHPDTGVIRLWDSTTWATSVLYKTPRGGGLSGMAFDSTGTRLATTVGVFEIASGKRLLNKPFEGVSLQWSPTGPLVAAIVSRSPVKNAVLIRDADTGGHVATLKLEQKQIQDFAFSPDGGWLAVVSNDETVRIWDTRDWKERSGFAWGIGKLKTIAFAPDGQRAACASHRGEILIWDWDL